MAKYFNTAGLCRPEKHYMVDPYRGLKGELMNLIRDEHYFVIHAPRQTGKTTLLHTLARQLNQVGEYIAVAFSVEQGGVRSFSESKVNDRIVRALYSSSNMFVEPDYMPPHPDEKEFGSLYEYLELWVQRQSKPIVLLMDEVDSLYDDTLVSLLRQLRDGFQHRPKGFPAAIALVGLRDIRDYKLKVRPESGSLGTGSPFNIKAESIMIKSFELQHVRDLLQQHTDETGQQFETAVVERIFQMTAGQPWLTNAIANQIVRKMLLNDYKPLITLEMVEEAKEQLIQRRDTHLDSLIDKLSEPKVKTVVAAILSGDVLGFDTYDEGIRYCYDLGIVAIREGEVRFANEIYQEIIPRVLNYNMQVSISKDYGDRQWYVRANGSLDMDKLLKAFQRFYRRHSEHWIDRFDYQEAGHQLLMMAFLQRVINGGGSIDREMAVGRGRSDLVIKWQGECFVLELKLKHLSDSREEGLEQLARYLDSLGEKHGYLILFEKKTSTKVPWEARIAWSEEVQEGKNITVVEM